MPKYVPPALTDHLLPFNWDVRKVWGLVAPVSEIAISEFSYLLELPLWSSVPNQGMLFDISPAEVICDPSASPYQTQRLADADTRFPIDLLLLNDRRWVLDGVHRIAKLSTLNVPCVHVRVHTASIITLISVG